MSLTRRRFTQILASTLFLHHLPSFAQSVKFWASLTLPEAQNITRIITATVASLVFVTIATLIGLHIRSRARLRTANAVASAATTHAATLQTDLTNQQLADAIAAEAHDTLAHSLSLMALNASARGFGALE